MERWDVIVVGAGHAGCEAALAAARMGARTLLLSQNLSTVAMMPCNPSIGGPGKGHLVRELYALGGEMPHAVDRAHLQMRELNATRGPAVRALRAQIDRRRYMAAMMDALLAAENLELRQAEAARFLLDGQGRIRGVESTTGRSFAAPTAVLTTGTYLDSTIIVGAHRHAGGPSAQLACLHLAPALRELGVRTRRLQTATPPRVHRRSIDPRGLVEIPGEAGRPGFTGAPSRPDPWSCWMTRTTEATIEAVRRHIAQSPLVLGNITDHGPHHCPSIDRKVLRFPDMHEHVVFLEPEGEDSSEIYLQGLTTSMPAPAQEAVLRSVPGLERAEIVRYGYAIEYDSVLPEQLDHRLSLRRVPGLFLAGQINGTSGYEEAAAQGWVAGVNAAAEVLGRDAVVLGRDEAYLGVLVDDLITKERNDPYRVTTSLAEFRLHLRSDNVCRRLMPLGLRLGLVPPERARLEREKDLTVDLELCRLESTRVRPDRDTRERLAALSTGELRKPVRLRELLSRPELSYDDLPALGHPAPLRGGELARRLDVEIKYGAYLDRVGERLRNYREFEAILLPAELEVHRLPGLAPEVADRVARIAPCSLGQLSRIEGVPAEFVGRVLHHLNRPAAERTSP